MQFMRLTDLVAGNLVGELDKDLRKVEESSNKFGGERQKCIREAQKDR